jgi:NitT/TauT family transport system ATP-binding protein
MTVAADIQALVALQNLGKSYRRPNGQEIAILESIILELRQGEIVALPGPSAPPAFHHLRGHRCG